MGLLSSCEIRGIHCCHSDAYLRHGMANEGCSDTFLFRSDSYENLSVTTISPTSHPATCSQWSSGGTLAWTPQAHVARDAKPP